LHSHDLVMGDVSIAESIPTVLYRLSEETMKITTAEEFFHSYSGIELGLRVAIDNLPLRLKGED